MNTKLVYEKTLEVIDQYLHFKIQAADGSTAVTNIPYFNNRHKVLRAGLRASIGKGSPRDIFDEVQIALAKQKNGAEQNSLTPGTIKNGAYVPESITHDSLKHFLVDQNIGIDCSGFAYYVLNSESIARGKGSLDRHLTFPFSKGILRKLRAKLRPIENTSVATLAHDKNSKRIILIEEIEPGDMITFLTSSTTPSSSSVFRDHILVIHQIEYQNFIPTTIHYSHSIAWPTDGEYGHGVRQGIITILDHTQALDKQEWLEKEWNEGGTLIRTKSAKIEIRRLIFF